MAHFAQINKNNIVERVLVIDQEQVNTGAFGEPSSWIQTSYNTQGGKHILGCIPLRKNYAGIGFTYDQKRDAFIPPQPFSSWTLNEETCNWNSPIPYPEDGKFYNWDEEKVAWVEKQVN